MVSEPPHGDEKGQAQIFPDRLFQAFDQPGCLDVGGATEFRTRKANDDGGGTVFADYVWKPIVLVEMKNRLAARGISSGEARWNSELFTELIA